ncbi:MAG TPA: ParB/RepB/Spo0J family partition protein [Gammaproteobacteria bacterium]|nr:ParB/RepB/Spo0J family partition protein [Gammaproteobacteria bacterium]
MAVKKRGLGRGLEALLSNSGAPAGREGQGAVTEGELRRLPVDVIQRGKYQPRLDMHTDTLQDLADSIRAQGVVQPIVVRPIGAERYEIIAGERRWRAAQLAGLHEVPAVVRDVPDQAAIAMALIENIQRENLNPLEEARALERLIGEFEMTHQQAADAVGRSRTAVTNLLRLLELNDDVKALVEHGELEMGHARALLSLRAGAQSTAAREVVAKGLSVRETERLVKRLESSGRKPAPAAPKADPDIRRLEQTLADRLGAGVQIQHSAGGKGRLVIRYTSLDELDGILERIR